MPFLINLTPSTWPTLTYHLSHTQEVSIINSTQLFPPSERTFCNLWATFFASNCLFMDKRERKLCQSPKWRCYYVKVHLFAFLIGFVSSLYFIHLGGRRRKKFPNGTKSKRKSLLSGSMNIVLRKWKWIWASKNEITKMN